MSIHPGLLSIPQLWSREKVDTSRIFHLPENPILTCLPWESETMDR